MAKITFTKKEIIEFFTLSSEEKEILREDIDSVKIDRITSEMRTKENWIKNIEKFIKGLFSDQNVDNNFFLENFKEECFGHFVAIHSDKVRAKIKKKGSYHYSIETALIIAVLLNTYKNGYFKAFRKGQIINPSTAEDWFKEMEKNLFELMEILKKKIYHIYDRFDYKLDYPDYESVLKMNIGSCLYHLSNIYNEVYQKKMLLKRLSNIYDRLDNDYDHAYDENLASISSEISIIEEILESKS
ncbi:MAG TPA: hypothetical protein PLV00_06770 [Caldisericia bacterium]|nr:hypothetical protein [Caldisericia bacterium]